LIKHRDKFNDVEVHISLIYWIFGRLHSKASTYTEQQNTGKCGHTSMPQAGLEPAILVFGRSKTLHAVDRTVIGTGLMMFNSLLNN